MSAIASETAPPVHSRLTAAQQSPEPLRRQLPVIRALPWRHSVILGEGTLAAWVCQARGEAPPDLLWELLQVSRLPLASRSS